jgi:ubiquinone/menaquinone biosynthesis C-methylase UbiE
MGTDYQEIAPQYDRRYALHRYDGVAECVEAFVGPERRAVLEVGCGTGHWVSLLSERGHGVVGIDRSTGMLERARQKVGRAGILLATAEAVPLRDGSVERVLIVNALHHFTEPARAIREARRVLAPGGKILIVGLQPRVQTTDWYVYTYFESTRERDLERFPAQQQLQAWLEQAGFDGVVHSIAQRFEQQVPARLALSTQLIAKHTTSQLADLTDADYERGITQIEQQAARAESQGRPLLLHATIELHATPATSP